MSYKIVCIECGSEYVPLKNGYWVCEVADFGPYKLWRADLVYCKQCKKAVISGFGQESIDHHVPMFKDILPEVKIFFGYNKDTIKVAKELQKPLDIPAIIKEMENYD